MYCRYLRMTAAAALFSACLAFPAMASEADNEAAGPGILIQEEASGQEEEPAEDKTEAVSGERGELLGVFTTSGYCNCRKCSGGHNLTFPPRVTPYPRISAVFPWERSCGLTGRSTPWRIWAVL